MSKMTPEDRLVHQFAVMGIVMCATPVILGALFGLMYAIWWLLC